MKREILVEKAKGVSSRKGVVCQQGAVRSRLKFVSRPISKIFLVISSETHVFVRAFFVCNMPKLGEIEKSGKISDAKCV